MLKECPACGFLWDGPERSLFCGGSGRLRAVHPMEISQQHGAADTAGSAYESRGGYRDRLGLAEAGTG